MIDFTMPSLGADMDEGTLNEWLVKPGDTVTRGQVVAIVETTKAAVEVECWHEGVVHELLVPVGETVAVGTILATLLAAGETAPAQPQPSARRAKKPQPVATTAAVAPAPAAAGVATDPHRRRWVSPAARRLAESLGIDVAAVSGTGPQGAVTIRDVEHAAASAKQPTGQADRGGSCGWDAALDCGGDESLQTRNPALLPDSRNSAGSGVGVDDFPQRSAADH